MARIQVKTPVKDFTGLVAGVAFGHGTAVLDSERDARALRYFRRRGYEVIDLDAQDEAEQADTEAAETAIAMPAESATKAAWKAYAISRGMPEEDADKATRDQLAQRYADDREGASQ